MSTPTRDLIIYGAGGIGREIASIAESGCHAGHGTPLWRVIAFVDDTPGFKGQIIHGVPCLGPLDEVIQMRQGMETWCHIAIGNNLDRRAASKRIEAVGWKAATLVHSSAGLSWEVELGEGTYVGLGATISPNVTVGRYAIINTRGSLGHHVVLGDFSQVSLNASVLGYGRVEEGAMIGAHGVVMSGVTVGAWATVAIGTPVLRSVQPGHTISLPLAKTVFKRNIPPD